MSGHSGPGGHGPTSALKTWALCFEAAVPTNFTQGGHSGHERRRAGGLVPGVPARESGGGHGVQSLELTQSPRLAGCKPARPTVPAVVRLAGVRS
jgi:hypothetical protein